MRTLTKLLLAAVLAAGALSGAHADAQFDTNVYRPAIQDNALDAYARVGTIARAAQPRAVRPFSPEEQRWFDKGSAAPSNG